MISIPADMAEALAQFDRNADEISKKLLDTVESTPLPKFLYHYTTDIGLRGILESGTIWLTDIFSLNDPSELSHSCSQAVKILSGKATNSAENIFAKQFEVFLEAGGLKASAHYFVSSFSARRDDLGQWRAYADDGRGYVLEFDASLLEGAYAKRGGVPSANNNSFYVSYDDNSLNSLYRQLIDLAFPLISMPTGRHLSTDAINKYMLELSSTLMMHVIRVAIFFKNEGYTNEEEYRFLQIYRGDLPAPDVRYRSRPYSLVRFREFDWKTTAAKALKQIFIGPASNEQAFTFANDCLRAFHKETVEIGKSNIPYRSGR